MFSSELLIVSGAALTTVSAIALLVAQSTRNWFFYGDNRADAITPLTENNQQHSPDPDGHQAS